MAIISFSRQVAAWGDEVAASLAEKLNYKFVKRTDIEKQIVELGFPKEKIPTYDERKPGFFASFASVRDEYLNYVQYALLSAAKDNNAVIIGRGAFSIFEKMENHVAVRLVADENTRIERLKTEFNYYDKNGKHEIDLNTPGYFSLYNAVAAISVALQDGIGYDAIRIGLSKAFVKGRMEIVPINKDYTVIIDFAHNEFSVKNLFETIKLYNPSRIISVFGCGGNRSKLRRYAMGEVIGQNSDLSIITSDNSRFEKVEDIIDEILIGMNKTEGVYQIIKERKKAIKEALRVAKEGDVILLIGKGHEMYEEIEGVKYPFDERQIVIDSLFELSQQDG